MIAPAVDNLVSDLALAAPRHGWADPAIGWALAAGPVFWLLASGLGEITPPGPDRPSAVSVAMALLWYPVLEELLFRGLIQGRLLASPWGRARWLGVSVANVVTACLFTALHLAVQSGPWPAAVLVPALIFGALRERTGSVQPSILVHAGYNASLLGAAWLSAG